MREKYSLEAIFLYFKTNLKDTTAVLSGDFDMIILPYYEFGLYLTLKKKEWELHVTIPNELKVCLHSVKLLLLDSGGMHLQNIMLIYCINYVC